MTRTYTQTIVHVVRYIDKDGLHELVYRDPDAAAKEEAQLLEFGLAPVPVTRERFMHRKHNPQANPTAEWIDDTCPDT